MNDNKNCIKSVYFMQYYKVLNMEHLTLLIFTHTIIFMVYFDISSLTGREREEFLRDPSLIQNKFYLNNGYKLERNETC